MTFENIHIGLCGATGVELVHSYHDAAGVNFDELQTITFAGEFTTSNYTAGNTVYMENYNMLGYTIPVVINGVIAAYGFDSDTLSNLQNENKEFAFVTFVFNQVAIPTIIPNESVLQYKDIDGAGIIKASELNGVNTTHKYIELDIIIGHPQAGNLNVGRAILFNQNYK